MSAEHDDLAAALREYDGDADALARDLEGIAANVATPAQALTRARLALEAVRDARRGDRGATYRDALEALTHALGHLAGVFARNSYGGSAWPTVAGWYAEDAQAAVWDAWQREGHIAAGHRDPVRYDPTELPLLTTGHALAVAAHALRPDRGGIAGAKIDAP